MMGQIEDRLSVAVQDGCTTPSDRLSVITVANHRGLDDAAAVGIVEKIISALFIVPSLCWRQSRAVGAEYRCRKT